MNRLRRDDRRQVVKDLILWVLLAISVTAMGPDPLRDLGAFGAVTVPRLVLTGLVVLVGRPWPLAAVALLLPLAPLDFSYGLATSDVSWFQPGATEVKIFPLGPVSPFVIWYAYLAGRRVPRALPALGVGALITAVGVAPTLTRGTTVGPWITLVSWLLGTYLIPYLLGLLRRRLLHQRDQARQAAEAQARLRERARIARDMHDSLGHELALIAVRAAGLELSPTLEPAHAKAAGELRAATADAIERLHQIIGVLREDPDPAAPQPAPQAPARTPPQHPAPSPSEDFALTPSERPAPSPPQHLSPTASEDSASPPSERPSPTPSEDIAPSPSERPSPSPSEDPAFTPEGLATTSSGVDLSVMHSSGAHGDVDPASTQAGRVDFDPAQGVHADVAGLVERARDSGMAISFRVEEPVPGVAYAVVREGLTNAAKHAPGAEVEVAVTPKRVVVRNGPPAYAPLNAPTGGFGLVGLSERARRTGGTLRAGAVDGGFEVVVELP
ncbi:histidine kinase [Nonomuraea sp. NPDC049649]|uniref:sensor histidine kinase n=1 Tax=Nonomuraea sp. NPDC049649 TaxID=3155776 RepID=UPI0034362598